MPGNELGDRVHNFFAQDNSSQGQHQSHVLEGNWPVLNSNYWVGSQRQIDVLNSSSKNYPLQISEIDGGQATYPGHAPQGINFSQSNLRPDTSKTRYISEQNYSNGVVYGNQFHQNRQNEANFLSVDSDSNQHHLLSLRGLSFPETEQGSGQELEKAPKRLETSIAPASLDLFGGQPQVNHQKASMMQALQHQQSGLNEMQLMQQQIMMRKMQEFQTQKQLKQLELRPQDLVSRVPTFIDQTSGSQSYMINDNFSDSSQYLWTAEPGTNWLNGSSAMQGSSNGLVFPQNMAQAQRLMDFVPQQTDQSLYGVPVSSSRGLEGNQYPRIVTSRSSMPKMETFSNSFHSSQHNFLSERIGGQESSPISRPNFQIENTGHASNQLLNTGITDRGLHQRVNSMPRNDEQLHFGRRKESTAQSENSHDRSTRQFSSSPSEAVLDPTEEKILYGSDDNIWAAFGKSPNMSGDSTCHLFDNGELSNGFPSIQSGSWSALMQSAVAETSSSGMGHQEEWSGLNLHGNVGFSANQLNLVHDNYARKASLPGDVRIPSTRNSGSDRSSEVVHAGNALGSNQLAKEFQQEPDIRVSIDASQRFRQSLDESSKWSNHNTLQELVAEGSQIYENSSQHSLDAKRITEKVSATWVPGKTGTVLERNGWNAQAALPPGGNGVQNHEAQLPPKSQNNRLMVMQDHGCFLWKSDPPNSASDFGSVKVGNHLSDKGLLNLNHASASGAKSCNMGVDDGKSSFVPNNNLFNQWKNAYPLAKFQGNDCMGSNQGLDLSNRNNKDEVKENSSDSHHSDLSQQPAGGLTEAGLSDACDSRSFPPGKQKLTNQHASKVSVPRKFQYHPMGNLDEDVEPTFRLKQPLQLQSSSLKNNHSVLSNQVSRYSSVTDEGECLNDNKGSTNEPTCGSFPVSASRTPFPFNQPLDSYVMNKASSPSQNMLELLHKVDQSRSDGAVAHLTCSDYNVSSQRPEAEKSDGSASHIHHSSVSKGFGLQLGPPSQCVRGPDLSLPSQNARDVANSMHTNHAGAEIRDEMLQPYSVQSLPFSNEGSLNEYRRSAGPDNIGDGNSLYKEPGNHQQALDTPYARNALQNKHIMTGNGKMAMVDQIDSSFGGGTSHSSQRGSAEAVAPDASCSIQKQTSHSSQRGSTEAVAPDASCSIQKHNLASHGGVSGASDIQGSSPSETASNRDQIHSSLCFSIPATSQHVLANVWNNIPSSQHSLASQYPKAPPQLSVPHQPNIVGSSPHADLRDSTEDHLSSGLSSVHVNAQGIDEEENRLKESPGQVGSIDSSAKVEESLAKKSSTKGKLEESPVTSVSTQKDIDVFGRSLKPNAFSNQNYAFLNQMRVVKDTQAEPHIRVSKRMKGPDDIFYFHQFHPTTGQQNEYNAGDMMGSSTGVSSEDSRMFKFTSSSDMMQRNTDPLGNVASQDILSSGLDASQNNPSDSATSVRAENHQVTPSWFNQYGHLKNGQTFPVCNARKRPNEPSSTVVESSSIMAAPSLDDNSPAASIDCQVGSTPNSAPTLVTNEHLSSAQSLLLTVTGEHKVISRTQKHKTATFELHPWQKEISDVAQNFLVPSVTEGDWSRAANRLTEKVQDDAELNEDVPPLLRSKRRLILTTQLMQQLFGPPPASILSADAISANESVIYGVSRVSLGDACSTVSGSSDFGHRDCLDLHSMNGKLKGGPPFVQVIEELLGKARKLEDDFFRLDKKSSVLALRVEGQELERFSVINRLARFHGRPHSDNAEASSSISAKATTSNPHIQRYVLALPMPGNPPDWVQCLSL